MEDDVDSIVAKLPPPDKLAAVGDVAEESEYSAEEDAALGVAKALGIPADKVDVQALCSALRDFNATSVEPVGPIEE